MFLPFPKKTKYLCVRGTVVLLHVALIIKDLWRGTIVFSPLLNIVEWPNYFPLIILEEFRGFGSYLI
jgi:accessory gene regulator protein AgrB